jgi:chromosome segregation ATPase
MSDYLYQLLIVVISSGALGTIVTAISKKRERQNIDNIQKVVNTQTSQLQSSIKSIQECQLETAQALEELKKTTELIRTEQKQIREEQQELKKSFNRFKYESEDLDLLIVQKLREKGIFNGESEVFVKKLLEYKTQREQEKEDK